MNEVAAALVARCRALGAAQAEAWIKIGSTRTVTLEPGGSVSWGRSAEGGAAVRAMTREGLVGFASCCGPEQDDRTVATLADAALDGARVPWAPLSDPLPAGSLSDGRGFGIFDHRLHTATPADLEGMLHEAASEALRTEPRVRRLDHARVAASSSEVWIANSSGLAGSYRQTLVHLGLGVAAGVGAASVVVRRSRTARSLSAFSPALFGDETARLAATALEGRPCEPSVRAALFAPAAAAELLRLCSGSLIAGSPLGTRVASPRLTILDDGRLPGGAASAPFDGEGVPTRRTTLVARGVFQETVHDLESAARCGAPPTGNGTRASFRDPPRRGPTNLFIAPGGDAPEDLLASMKAGAWIQSLRPTPAVTAGTGAVSALAIGRLVEGGAAAGPVAGILVTLPLPGLLWQVTAVGNDLTFGTQAASFGAPSLLLDGVGLRPA